MFEPAPSVSFFKYPARKHNPSRESRYSLDTQTCAVEFLVIIRSSPFPTAQNNLFFHMQWYSVVWWQLTYSTHRDASTRSRSPWMDFSGLNVQQEAKPILWRQWEGTINCWVKTHQRGTPWMHVKSLNPRRHVAKVLAANTSSLKRQKPKHKSHGSHQQKDICAPYSTSGRHPSRVKP